MTFKCWFFPQIRITLHAMCVRAICKVLGYCSLGEGFN
uniref:Uncharacterized protein n=1 Tax=Rhizophora mucronata TaxID=61149 RepID=A0A2P2PVT8_RHIMU